MKLSQIAGIVSGDLEGEDLEITGIATLEEANPGQVTFLSNTKYAKLVPTTKASAIILDRKFDKPAKLSVIRADDPYVATLMTVKLFHPDPKPEFYGIHSSAVISKSAVLGENVTVEACSVIGDNVKIGDNTRIGPNVVIEKDVIIGSDTLIHAGSVIRHGVKVGNRVILHPGVVLGAEGFGFAPIGGRYEKIPQVGIVIVEDDVDIGANTTIDRAFLGATRICQGAKLDNLIQIAHNVVVGPHTVIAAQTGISGSTTIGQGVMIGGQVGTVGHIEIGDGVKIGAQSGVSKDVPPGITIFGYPAKPIMETKRIEASLRKLPEIPKKLADLDRRIKELEK